MGSNYQQALAYLKDKGYQLPVASTPYAENIYWVFGIVAPTENEKEDLIDHLTKHKIGTRPFFWCMHEQPVFKKMNLFAGEHYPVAEKLARNGFYLPSGLGLTIDELTTITTHIHEKIV